MNTGGQAFPGTLLDWFAGQALAGFFGYITEVQTARKDADLPGIKREEVVRECYEQAEAMLAEKARREAVVKESSTTDHSGDSNKMVELEARNRELVERIKRLEDAGNDLVWWFCQGELLQQLSPVQTSALKQWRDLRGRRNP